MFLTCVFLERNLGESFALVEISLTRGSSIRLLTLTLSSIEEERKQNAAADASREYGALLRRRLIFLSLRKRIKVRVLPILAS